jgi:uncharacterized protein Usg
MKEIGMRITSQFLLFFWTMFVCINIVSAQTRSSQISFDGTVTPFTMKAGTNGYPIQDGTNRISWYQDLGLTAWRNHDLSALNWQTIFPNWDADPELESSYNFTEADKFVKPIYEANINVLFRLGSSWSSDPTSRLHFPPGSKWNTSGTLLTMGSPTDYTKFANISKHIVMHYADGWASGFKYDMSRFRWEIWNEPSSKDKFWAGSFDQFKVLFAEVAKTLKSYRSDLYVGGPGHIATVMGTDASNWIQNLLAYCKSQGVQLDFWSWHHYGMGPEFPVTSPSFYKHHADKMQGYLDAAGYTTTKQVVTEWGAGQGTGSISDTGKGAAFYAAALQYMNDLGVTESYVYRSDVHAMGLLDPADNHAYKASEVLKWWKSLTTNAQKLAISGNDSTNHFTITASKANDGSAVRILVGNYGATAENWTLNLNLPLFINKRPYLYHYVTQGAKGKGIGDANTLVETIALAPSGMNTKVFQIKGESAHFFEVKWISSTATDQDLPNSLAPVLETGFPNPFQDTQTLRYYLPAPTHTKLVIYDLMGRKMAELVDAPQNEGHYAAQFDAKYLPSGVYFAMLTTDHHVVKQKLNRIK